MDAQERAAFVAWRRELAAVEEGEGLVLTPFEKNLEVWRQLWRVLERSHIVVQARPALLFHCYLLPFCGRAVQKEGRKHKACKNVWNISCQSFARA